MCCITLFEWEYFFKKTKECAFLIRMICSDGELILSRPSMHRVQTFSVSQANFGRKNSVLWLAAVDKNSVSGAAKCADTVNKQFSLLGGEVIIIKFFFCDFDFNLMSFSERWKP